MAIYHLTASAGSRFGGASASAKYDYITREGRYERDASEVRHAESGHMPCWAADRPRSYWEAADAHERANGRLYREIHVALPAELSRDRQKALARQLARDITGGGRLPYTLAIHEGAPRESGEPANPHAHLVWSDRGLDGRDRTAETWFRRYNARAPEKGGARKHSEANGPRWLHRVRERWAERTNQALERAGRRERVDHRSLAVRAVEAADAGDMEKAARLAREPNVHLGPAAMQSIERMANGKAPMRTVERALAVEERNAVWPRLEREEARLRLELAELPGRIEQARRQLERRQREKAWNRALAEHEAAWKRSHGGRLLSYRPELGGYFVTGRDGRTEFTEGRLEGYFGQREPPRRERRRGPDRGPERDFGPSR